jgi:hypothetical protein
MVARLDPLLTNKRTFRAPTQGVARLCLVSEILRFPIQWVSSPHPRIVIGSRASWRLMAWRWRRPLAQGY